MLTRRTVILAKIEATYNVDPTPTGAADAVQVEGFKWSLAGLRMNDRQGLNASLAKLQQVYGGALLQLTFTAEIKGSGAAGTAPEIDPLLRACGLGVTTVPATSVTYAPVSSSIESCTIYAYEDGKCYRITGCRGTAEFDVSTGAIGKINFTLTGHLTASNPTDTALPTPTYDATVPAPCIDATAMTVGGTGLTIGKMMLALNNTVATPPDVTAPDGFSDVQITARDVAGSLDPEDVLKATKDFIGELQAGTSAALVLGTIGGTAGNIFGFTAPAVYWRNVSPAERDGVKSLDIPFGCAESSGDDEFALAFT